MSALMFSSVAAAQPPSGLSSELLSVGLSLALVVLAIIFLALLVKRFNPNLGNSQDFKVIRSLPLGSKERLLVIEIDDKQHLLGVTPHSINYLYQLESPLEATPTAPFAKELSRLMSGANNNKK
ncbi:flagellar biosynthetic protein FliO [Pseudoalteromonas rubra]|uniref:Flagellar protein n=1 Tax=Pseudoalteromonas rubra TaxID=43658 RepID=A0A4Q7EC38_9GAMM|nr:flagellar biosynthetic protein FliO [Pseudoalteromonas rubra]RZM80293.1 flagellar biosynthetic protein FliO [Pseudoalteromonas rubra]